MGFFCGFCETWSLFLHCAVGARLLFASNPVVSLNIDCEDVWVCAGPTFRNVWAQWVEEGPDVWDFPVFKVFFSFCNLGSLLCRHYVVLYLYATTSQLHKYLCGNCVEEAVCFYMALKQCTTVWLSYFVCASNFSIGTKTTLYRNFKLSRLH